MEKFVESLALRILEKIPGMEAHSKMAPFPERLKELPSLDHQVAAVMIVLMEVDNQICFPLIQRNPSSTYDPHKGQFALPGGRQETSDPNLAFTALREVEEEIGIASESIQIIGSLSPLYIPVSKNLVYPFIGWLRENQEFKKQDSEIHEIFNCSVQEFL
ncbi:MAG: CoA pyrophosphatase, partial [Saprospiraceae bacterium]